MSQRELQSRPKRGRISHWLSLRDREPGIILRIWLLMFVACVNVGVWSGFYSNDQTWPSILVELHGTMIELLLVSIIALVLIRRAEHQEWKPSQGHLYSLLLESCNEILFLCLPSRLWAKGGCLCHFGDRSVCLHFDVRALNAVLLVADLTVEYDKDMKTRREELDLKEEFDSEMVEKQSKLRQAMTHFDRLLGFSLTGAKTTCSAEVLADALDVEAKIHLACAAELSREDFLKFFGFDLACLAGSTVSLSQLLCRDADEVGGCPIGS